MDDLIAQRIAEVRDALAYTLEAVKRPAKGALAHPYLVPGGPYEELWDWDAFFIGAGLLSEDPAEAVWLKYWALNFLDHAGEDGRIAGSITPEGPRKLLHAMKPFLAQGILLASRDGGDTEWVRDRWKGIRRAVTHRERTCWCDAVDLPLWHDAMESGADDNPAALDFPNATVAGADAGAFTYREYAAMTVLARRLDLDDEAHYFEGRARAVKAAMLTHLWNDEDKIFYNLDTATMTPIRVVSYAAMVPLWAGIAPREAGRESLERYLLAPEHLASDFGGRSLSRSHPEYNNVNRIKPHSNWQGPVWPLATYLYAHALMRYDLKHEALDLAGRVTDLVLRDIGHTGGMHENYDAETGKPLAAPNFISWNLLIRGLLAEIAEGRDPLALPDPAAIGS